MDGKTCASCLMRHRYIYENDWCFAFGSTMCRRMGPRLPPTFVPTWLYKPAVCSSSVPDVCSSYLCPAMSKWSYEAYVLDRHQQLGRTFSKLYHLHAWGRRILIKLPRPTWAFSRLYWTTFNLASSLNRCNTSAQCLWCWRVAKNLWFLIFNF